MIYVCEFSNFFPIAEMFLIHPETLSEENFEIFLKIISNMLNYRKQNLINIKKYKFFNILSMFIEKYPPKVFTAKIMDSFFKLGKLLFISDSEKICSNYFKHILLNEKILSKYDSNLQIEFWNKLFSFYISDKEQMQTFLNINRLCLILRFYDRNKYTEMCCEHHLNMIKDEYKGSLKVMNPSMSEKLSNLKNLMDSVIESREKNNAIYLFKLLTLDLSPCLVKFILNIFINAFKKKENEKWSKDFVFELSKIKFGIIIINTFTHSLPDVRIELLKFMQQVHKRLITTGNESKFTIFENMLKTCLLPDKKFYIKNITKKPGTNIANPPKKDANNKEEPKNDTNNTNNNAPAIKGKSKFAELLSKFEKTQKPNENNDIKKNNLSLKLNEFPKKNEKNENIRKTTKPIDEHNNNSKKNEINKLKKEKQNIVENKINEDIKSKSNQLNNNKFEDKKPSLKTKLDKNIINNSENKNKTYNINNKDSSENNPINKKNINEKTNSINDMKAIFESKKNAGHSMTVYQKNPKITKTIDSKQVNFVKNENKDNKNKDIKKVDNKKNEDKDNIVKFESKNTCSKNESKDNTNKTELKVNKNSNENKDIINKNEIKNNTDRKKTALPKNSIKENSNINNPNNSQNNISTQNKKKNTIIPKGNKINLFDDFSQKNPTIIKDDEINDYIHKLYSIFILWAIENDIESNLETIKLEESKIKFVDILEFISLLNKHSSDKKMIIEYLKAITKLINNSENSFDLFFNKKIYASFLDLTFENYKQTSKEKIECFDLGKNILITLFINSFVSCQKSKKFNPGINPGNEVETLFIWGDNFLEHNSDKEKIDLLYEFLYELFFEFLLNIKLKCEEEITFNEANIDINKNYKLKNYLMFITIIFNFAFKYKLEKEIHYNGLPMINYKTQKIEIPKEVLSSMRMKDSKNDMFNFPQDWVDFPLINDIFNRYKYIWVKNYVFKNLDVDKYKKDKASKYKYILENLIFNKEKKNIFKDEIFIFCLEYKLKDLEYIIPLIKIIPFTIMSVLEKIKNTKNEESFLIWLKDLKDFIRFIIIASSNLNKNIESYKQIQEICLEVVASGLLFLKNLYEDSKLGQEKIMKSLSSIFLLILKLLKWNLNYQTKHLFKKISLKLGNNDISSSCIVQLFNEYCKDSNGNVLLNNDKIDSLFIEDDSKCISEIIKFLHKKEFLNAFWENPNLKKKLLFGFFSLNSYKNSVDFRYGLIPYLEDSGDESYKKSILDLLPQYETELAKYSNNSLEKNIRNKNKYKSFKKIVLKIFLQKILHLNIN